MECNKLEKTEKYALKNCRQNFFILKIWEGRPDFDLSEFVKESADRVVRFHFRDGLL